MKAVAVHPHPAAETDTRQHGLPTGADLLDRLGGIVADRGQTSLAHRLADLADLVASDMAVFEKHLDRLERPEDLPRDARLVAEAGHHLLARGGKRLRPMCVLLAARLGRVETARVFDLAVAIELVHSATLLHDDVVDLGDARRGAATARAIYGNAASIFAGDWLLVEALRRVSHEPVLLHQLFDTIEEMIWAESVQLENRGRLDTARGTWTKVVEGKTAAVFRWAMRAGAHSAGLDDDTVTALECYGRHVGIAFQATDDLLDLTGDATHTGKALFTDLREGKMTYPLILALERDETLAAVVEGMLSQTSDEPVSDAVATRVVETMRRTGAVSDCLDFARGHADAAIAELRGVLPPSRPRHALETIAEAIVDRDL